MAKSNEYEVKMIPLQSNNHDAQTTYKTDNLNLEVLCINPRYLWLNQPEILQSKRTPCAPTPDGKKVDKLKAGHLPMCMLEIGFFKIEAKYATDLVAKFYYGKRRLVWERLNNGFKDKIEIPWQNISAIRATIEKNSPGVLEIELDKVPSFFHEMELKPGKHSTWTLANDFTKGQASQCRRHYLRFAPGVLNQHYAKLLQCDNRLMELSQRPYPSSPSPYFDSHVVQRIAHFSSGHGLHVDGSKTISPSEQQYAIFEPMPLIANDGPYSDHGGICSPTDEAIINQMFEGPVLTSWNQCLDHNTLLARGWAALNRHTSNGS